MEVLIPTVERMPTVDVSDIQDIINRTSIVVEQATQIAKTVHNQATTEAAVAWCQAVQAESDRVNSKYALLRDFLHKSHKAVTSGISNLVNPRDAGIRIVKDDGLRRWKMEEERKRRAEEERLAAEQRKRDEEQKLAAAVHLEKENPVLSEAILNSPVMSTPPVVQEVKPKGMGAKKIYAVRLKTPYGKIELIKAIAGGKVPDMAVQVDMKWLTKQANQMDGNLLGYEGVVVEEDMNISIRRAVV